MKRSNIVFVLVFVLLGGVLQSLGFADSAVYPVANAPQEDTYAGLGSSDVNGYNHSSGWQYFGYSQSMGCRYHAFWRWAIDIPKGSTISSAYVQIRADYSNTGVFEGALSALVPDGRWENANGFSTTNYQQGSNLERIPRQGTPVPWENISNWDNGVWYATPDISNLVQARIDNPDYRPQDERGKYFGLVLAHVSGLGYRTGTQEPDTDLYTAQLHVEWIPGPPPPPSIESEAIFSVANFPEEDTFACSGAKDFNGFNNSYGWLYFGYASSTASRYTAYWRWTLSIPRGAKITEAYVKIRSDYSNSGYLDAAFQALVPDGKWESGMGFSSLNYPNGSSLNAIARLGEPVAWNDIPAWTAGTWFFSPDLSDLIQERINGVDYTPQTAEGRLFGLALSHTAGSWYRTGTQEPDLDSSTAKLYVRWIPDAGCGDPNAIEICQDGRDNNCNDEIDEYCNGCPIANAGADRTVSVGQSITLDGSASTDVDGDALMYSWAIAARPEGSMAELFDPAAVMPAITTDTFGEYVLQLMVSDGLCESAPDDVTLSTINSCPTADAGPDQSARVGSIVTLDGAASRDEDGDQLRYEWALVERPEGSAATITSVFGAAAAFAVDRTGQYAVELRVSDELCESIPDIVIVTTENSPPIADAGADQQTAVGECAQLDGSASYDLDGDPLYFFWTILYPPVESAALVTLASSALSDPSSPAPTLSVQQEADYVVQLIVSDGNSQGEPDTCLVSVIVPDYACPLGKGYWANHPEGWPVDSLMLGDNLYQKPALLSLLKMAVRGDASVTLAHQLIAVKLNLENGSDPRPIRDAVAASDEMLRQVPGTLPCRVKASTSLGMQMLEEKAELEQYNQGLLTEGCIN